MDSSPESLFLSSSYRFESFWGNTFPVPRRGANFKNASW